MKCKWKWKPLQNMTMAVTCFVFLIVLVVTTLQGLCVYLYFKLWYDANIPPPNFGRPIPLLFVLCTGVGIVLSLLTSHVPLKPVRELIAAINRLADGDFTVRIQLDTTRELVKLSESFNQMASELENTELLRSDFINNFSHEFKTPIVSLRGFAKILKRGDLSEQEREEYLDIIISESDRLSRLATNVLNLSKIEKTSIVTEKKEFNLSEDIRQSILLLESKWQKKELELVLDLDEVMFYGNQSLLGQVWINLIDNAVKFSPDRGEIRIALYGGNGAILFQIRDFGCGMDEETRRHIFDRFYQGDPSHTTEGNGIGLTIVKKIVELHRGSVTVESVPQKGTMFTVCFSEIGTEGTKDQT